MVAAARALAAAEPAEPWVVVAPCQDPEPAPTTAAPEIPERVSVKKDTP